MSSTGDSAVAVTGPEQQVSWFTGRRLLLDELDRWLARSDADRRARVVTGAPGSGKSALLEQLARRHQADGLIDAVMYAHGRTLTELLQDFAELTEASEPTPAAVLTAVRRRQRPQRAVVDGIEEAAEPDLIMAELITPLTTLAWGTSTRRVGEHEVTVPKADLRLVLAAGRESAAHLASHGATVVDLDAQPRRSRLEIAAYVLRRLLGEPDSPYRGRSLQARRAARAVAARSRGSFFVARAVSDLLVARSVPTEPRDLPYFSPGKELAGAFEVTLAHHFGPDAARARDLLRPLAYVEGTGLPLGELWASMAVALADKPYTSADVDWLVAAASAYVASRTEAGQAAGGRAVAGQAAATVHRLRHTAIAAALRGPDQAADQARLTEALLDQVPVAQEWEPRGEGTREAGTRGEDGRSEGTPEGSGGGPAGDVRRDWSRASRYVRTHVAAHAAAAGRLGELLEEAAYLVAAPPARLARLLKGNGPAGKRSEGWVAAESYRRAAKWLTDGDLGGNAARLELAARCLGADALAERLASLPVRRPWRALWARWRQEPAGGPDVLPDGLLTTVAATSAGGPVVLATGSADGQVRAWSPATGEPLSGPLLGHDGWVAAVALPDHGRPLVLSGGQDGMLRAWALPSGEPAGAPMRGHDGWITAVRVVNDPAGRRVISGGDDGTVRVWDLDRGEQAIATFKAHDGWVSALDAAVLPDGRGVAVSAGYDRTLRVWDLTTMAELRATPAGSASWITAVTILTLPDGRTAVAGGKSDGSMRLWDLASCEPLAPPFPVHTTRVAALTSTALPSGEVVLVSGSHDRTVQVLRPSGERTHRIELDSSVHELAVSAPGELAIAAGGGLCLVRLANRI
jgi:hypothetical protein